MKTIDRKNFVTIGKVLKTHGIHGELTVEHDKKPGKWAFLEIQGKPVPFKVLSSHPTTDNIYLLKLDGIHSVEQASAYSGYDMLAPEKPGKRRIESDHIEGYMIVDENIGPIGTVEELLEMPMQWLIQTTYLGKEVLIPAVEPIITSIDDKRKRVLVSLPEGLIETE